MTKVMDEKTIRSLIETDPDQVPQVVQDIYLQSDAISIVQKSIDLFIEEMKGLNQFEVACSGNGYTLSFKIEKVQQ